MRSTVLAALTRSLLEAASEAGHDAAALRAAAGLSEADLADPDARVPFARHAALWEALCALPGDVGLELGPRLGGRALGVVGFCVQQGATVREALALQERYRALVLDDALPRLHLRGEGEGARAVLVQTLPPHFIQLRHPAEAQASGTLTFLRALTGKPLVPREVSFPHPRPADTRRHEALFRAPLHFGAPAVELVFDASVLAVPLPRSDSALLDYLRRRADALLAELPEDARTADRVRRCVAELLPEGEPQLGQVARRLALSARTLHRRLAEEGTGFSALVDEVRRTRALALLEDGKLAASQVAFLLGFQDPAAFFRAFRRWTGTTPRAWREGRSERGGS